MSSHPSCVRIVRCSSVSKPCMDVTIEGLETHEQAQRMRELAIQYAQGFYFARPVRAEEVVALLSASPQS